MRTFPAAAVLLALTLAGCTGGDGGGAGGGTGPTLLQAPADPATGTTWDFEFSGASSGTSHAVLEARETKSGHEAARLKTTLAASGASSEITAWNRRSDGGQIEAHSSTQAPYIGSLTTTTTWNPPCVPLHYPVKEGDSYGVSCTSTTTTNAGGQPAVATTTQQVEILGQESVTVPAGTFDAIHVRFTNPDGSVTDSHYLGNGCGIAKSVTAKSGSPPSTMQLKSTTCA